MSSFLTHHRRRILVTMAFLSLFMAGLCGQLGYLMIFRSEHYSTMADDLHERERTIKAARGEIVDRNGTVIASNRTVCTVSVVHNQVEEPEAVIRMLSGELERPGSRWTWFPRRERPMRKAGSRASSTFCFPGPGGSPMNPMAAFSVWRLRGISSIWYRAE